MARASVRRSWQVTLPPEVREALRIEEGDELEFELVAEGEVRLRGLKLIPADQAWFWADSWQGGEQEATEDIRQGRTTKFDTVDEMFRELGS